MSLELSPEVQSLLDKARRQERAVAAKEILLVEKRNRELETEVARLNSRIVKLTSSARFVEFEQDVTEVRQSLNALDVKVQALETSMKDILTSTAVVIQAMKRNTTALTVMSDSVTQGLNNLEASGLAADVHITSARNYLNKALRFVKEGNL